MTFLAHLARACVCACTVAPSRATAAVARARLPGLLFVPGGAASAPAGARFAGIFARASAGGPILALERVRAKASLEGVERLLKRRRAYVKPTLQRQTNVKDAKYNIVKRQRARLVEELVLQKRLWPWG